MVVPTHVGVIGPPRPVLGPSAPPRPHSPGSVPCILAAWTIATMPERRKTPARSDDRTGKTPGERASRLTLT